MYGWRARIGLMIPSTNTVAESEFSQYLPPGISAHSARMYLKDVTEENLVNMPKECNRCAKLLASAKVNVIVYACTTGSLIKGKGFNIELENEIESLTKIPTITTATAVLKALESRSVKRLLVATPYIKEVNQKEKEFLHDNGFEVVSIQGLNIKDPIEIGKLEPHIAYNLAVQVLKENVKNEVEALFISCTDFRTFEIIETLAQDSGKFIISSNLATLWYALQKININLDPYDLLNISK